LVWWWLPARRPRCFRSHFRSATHPPSASAYHPPTVLLRQPPNSPTVVGSGGLIFFDQSVNRPTVVGSGGLWWFGGFGWLGLVGVVVVQHNAFSRDLCDDLCYDCVAPWSLLSFCGIYKVELTFLRVAFSPVWNPGGQVWEGGGSIQYIYIYIHISAAPPGANRQEGFVLCPLVHLLFVLNDNHI